MKALASGMLVVFVLALAPAAGAASRNPFTGAWRSPDLPGDGSTQLLTIGVPGVVLQDMYASVCAKNGAESVHLVAAGFGEIDGGQLVVEFPRGGGCGTFRLAIDDIVYTYHSDSDTLTDRLYTWTRIP